MNPTPFDMADLDDNPNATCVPPDAFVQLHMHNARIVRSNLGGQGGLCSRNASDCDEPYNNVTTPGLVGFFPESGGVFSHTHS